MTATCSPDERAARAALSALVEPGTLAAVRVARHVRTEGPASALALIGTGAEHLDPDLRMSRRAPDVDGSHELARGATVGARFLCPGDAEWPTSLDILDITLETGSRQGPSPLGLWIRGAGNLAAVTTRSVAVVGSRAATEYGLRVAAELAADLATAGWTIVSGAAYGIDAAPSARGHPATRDLASKSLELSTRRGGVRVVDLTGPARLTKPLAAPADDFRPRSGSV